MEETIMSQQEEIKNDHFLYRKDMYYLLAPMQHKDDISSWYMIGMTELA